MRLPPTVREWYSYDGALPILAAHSNDDPPTPETALRLVWDLDGVGESFYGCSEIAKVTLAKLRPDA